MGDIDIDIDVKDSDKVAPALRRGMRQGFEESGRWLQRKGIGQGRNAIMSTDRIWRSTLFDSFSSTENEFSRYYHWQGKIQNDAPHARIVDNGVKPGNNPSVQDILPWVSGKVIPNAAAQNSAAHADLNNWDPQLEKLAKEYSPAMVIAAFAIKGGLEKKGYPGIDFTDQIESYLESQELNVKRKAEKEMNRALRKAGLK